MCKLTVFVSLFLAVSLAHAQAPAGMVLSLDGNGDYMKVPDDPSLDSTLDVTVEALVRPFSTAATDSANGTPVATKWKNTLSTEGSWFLTVNPNNNPVFATSADGVGGQPALVSSEVLPLGQWSHVAGVYDGAQDLLMIYVNGALAASAPGRGGLFAGKSNVLVGAAVYFQGSFFFNGELDEVRIWNIARNASQLTATKDGPLPAAYYSTADSGLVAYWTFEALENLGVNNDGTDDVRDLSIFQNHGDLVGQATIDTPKPVSAEDAEIPRSIALGQNYPNPFNPVTRIPFTIDRTSNVRLSIIDVYGREVAVLINETLAAGSYDRAFDGDGLSSGVYGYRLETGNEGQLRLMTLLK